MSPSWLDRIGLGRWRIGLAPLAAEALRLDWRGRAAGEPLHAACSPRAGEAPWAAAVEALPALLDGAGARGGSATVVLSNHFVRYDVLPWQPALHRESEWIELARHRFAERHGDAAAGWRVRVDLGRWGRPALACAVDEALLEALAAACEGAGLRLAGVQPLLMAAWNAHRARLADDAAFALVEPGRVCLGLLAAGTLEAVVSRRSGGDAALAVEQELATLRPGAALPLALLRVGGAAWAGRDADEWPASALAGCGVR